ncbi:hypothetical protein HJC23_010541 [Cyclotella cryptica]|uniref:Uncharacterized protein n=1 Tax=Cyclotella cryptica TaxID=29204 RepID=A0ABD3QHF3_9STRA|eukprot:CCRYP_007134-RA/>CCRYP_007134-RA protein AED:0.24 eAED:0.24 QI:0/-1/0/1/-1/1/1/0/195
MPSNQNPTLHAPDTNGDTPETNNTTNNENQSNEDDEYDELDQINFPITILTKENRASMYESDKHAATNNNNPRNTVDENAILRCFGLSVMAHVQCEPVSRFEPMEDVDEVCVKQSGEDCFDGAVSMSRAKLNGDDESRPNETAEDGVHGSMSASQLEIDGESTKMNATQADATSPMEKKTWTPALVPLPPWALHL